MYLKPLLLVILFSCILLRPDRSMVAFFGAGNPPAEPHYLGDVAVDCGSIGNSTALDGREWIGDTGSELMSSLQPRGKTRSSTAADKLSSVDGVPYRTSRISATPFQYTFRVTPGARMVGLNNRFYIIENSTALEVVQRLNIGGGSISPIEDFGMFRRWSEDSKYLQESGVHRVSHLTNRIKYTNMPAFVAPPRLYHTAWKIGRGIRGNEMYKFTWKIPIDLGFGYLVRLHFCDFDAGMAESRQREFTIHINNHIAENKADLIGWSGGTEIPVYRDYLVMVKGEKEVRNYDLLISLQSVDELVFGLLNGLEVFKLSNPDNSLATPNPLFPRRASKIWNLKIPNLFSAFGQSNAVSTGMTIIIMWLCLTFFSFLLIFSFYIAFFGVKIA
ncbi:receptor-like protein kinase FERONIA [Coffea eugenioides]|uniref:receptor-like protein kinase FERONIA n=1 Tax=Coffea eugenioides TaxID=49369 RepID=UPI000F60A5EF|nr:receptor-like protein kinase FERONIA [Coffea eugenioides]